MRWGDGFHFSLETPFPWHATILICLWYCRFDDILDAVLPAEHDGIGGYSGIGHIIHLNIKDELLDYKYLIGWYSETIHLNLKDELLDYKYLIGWYSETIWIAHSGCVLISTHQNLFRVQ